MQTTFVKKKINKSKKYKIIFASGSSSVINAQSDPIFDYKKNVKNLVLFLDYLIEKKIKVSHFIYLSTASVIGNKKRINENDAYNPLSIYSLHKMLGEIYLKEFSIKHEIKLSILRIFTIYGDDIRKQFLWDLVNKIKNRTNNKIILFGNGEEVKDYFHINDLVKCIVVCLQKQKKKIEIFNVSSGEQIKIKKIVRLFLKELNLNEIIIKYNNKHSKIFPKKMISDHSKFKKFFKFLPIKFEVGLKNYLFKLKKNNYV